MVVTSAISDRFADHAAIEAVAEIAHIVRDARLAVDPEARRADPGERRREGEQPCRRAPEPRGRGCSRWLVHRLRPRTRGQPRDPVRHHLRKIQIALRVAGDAVRAIEHRAAAAEVRARRTVGHHARDVVGREHHAARVRIDRHRLVGAGHLVEIGAGGIEHLDAVVLAIADQHAAVRHHPDAVRRGELARAVARPAPGADMRAGRGEAMHDGAAVAVRDIDVAGRRDRDAARMIERLSAAGRARRCRTAACRRCRTRGSGARRGRPERPGRPHR